MHELDVNILHNGNRLEGFTDFMLYQSIKSLASMFTFKIECYDNLNFNDEDEIKIFYGNKLLFNGHVEVITERKKSTNDYITVSGRNKPSGLVDCSAENYKEFYNINIVDFAKNICAPFGINVKSKLSNVHLFPVHSTSVGETAFKVLAKSARKAGCLFYSDYNGDLILEPIGEESLDVEIREHDVLGRTRVRDAKHKFSEIIIRSQNIYGNVCGSVVGSSKRYRPLTLLESAANNDEARRIATWENLNRLQLSEKREINVREWQYKDGHLWELNKIIKLNTEKDNGDFLITDLILFKENKNPTTILGLENVSNYRI